MASAVTTLAWIEAERGASLRAATLLGCADGLRESVGASAPRPFGNLRERTESLALDRIDSAAFASAVDRGRAMDSDEVLAFAEDHKPAVKSGSAATTEPGNPLTRREMEIARLIADGMTSPQIGAKLFISELTVESHVTNMLNKLGFNSTLQLAMGGQFCRAVEDLIRLAVCSSSS